MSDVLEYTANAGNVFDVQNRIIANQERMGGAFARTGAAGDHIGHSFLRSDRAVSRASSNLVSNLLQVNSAADAVSAVLGSFERATHFGLGIGIGLGIATKAYEVLHGQIVKTHEAEAALDKDIAAPKTVALGLNQAGLEAEAGSIQKDITTAQKEGNSPTQNAADILKYGPKFWTDLTGQKGTDTVDQERSDRIAAGQSRLRDVQAQIGKLMQQEADYGDRNLFTSERDVELKKAQLDSEEKINALRKAAGDAPNAGLDQQIRATKQIEQQKEDKINLKADQEDIQLSEAAEKSLLSGKGEERNRKELLITYGAEAKALERIISLHGSASDKTKAEIALANTRRSISENLGDRLSETPQQRAARENTEREQKRRSTLAEEQINDARERERNGAQLDENNPVTQALRAIQKGEKAQKGEDPEGKDFKGVGSLAGLEFKGLQALNNLQISVAQ